MKKKTHIMKKVFVGGGMGDSVYRLDALCGIRDLDQSRFKGRGENPTCNKCLQMVEVT